MVMRTSTRRIGGHLSLYPKIDIRKIGLWSRLRNIFRIRCANDGKKQRLSCDWGSLCWKDSVDSQELKYTQTAEQDDYHQHRGDEAQHEIEG